MNTAAGTPALAASQQEPQRRWTPAQLKTLEDMWYHSPIEQVALHVRKPASACISMANYINLRRRDGILSPSIVAAELDTHPNTILKWCHLGYIPARRSEILMCPKGAVWEIDQQLYAIFKECWFATPLLKRRMPYFYRLFMERVAQQQNLQQAPRA